MPPETPTEDFMLDRAFLLSELQRLKEDVGELFTRFNALKDSATTDKLALLSQLNAEFTSINEKFSSLELRLSRVVGQHDLAEAGSIDKLAMMRLEIDNKLLQFRSTLSIPDNSKAVEDNANAIDDLTEEVKAIGKSVEAFDKKLLKLTWTVGLIVGVVLFIVNNFGVDFVKSKFKSPDTSPPATSPTYVTQPIQQPMQVVPQSSYPDTSYARTVGGR